jgi:uncharacterized protein (TIGR03437 family)
MLPTAQAQYVQQGPKLVGTSSSGGFGSQQGWKVALSADGNTAITGGPEDNNQIGAAWVFTRSGGVWAQQGSKLTGIDAVGKSVAEGSAVALSADGNTAIVGGNLDYGEVGAAWVYARNDGVWTQQGPKLVGTGATGLAQQGACVALSGDGSTALVSGPFDSGEAGAVWVFTRSGSSWTQQGPKLVGIGVTGYSFQCSAALSADGNTALIGGLTDNSGKGAAWVFTRSGNSWQQQGEKLVGTGSLGAARQGWSVALSADGNTAMVGGPFDNVQIGAAWIFSRINGVWTQQGDKLTSINSAPIAYQGYSVALSADGNTGIVGAYYEGGAWVFIRSHGAWSQLPGKLIGIDQVGPAGQGYSVAISGDAKTVLLGGPYDLTGLYGQESGATWAFSQVSGPTISSVGVVNGASFLPGIAPGAWVSITGANLSTTTRSWAFSDFAGNNLPTKVDGVSVTIGGIPAYIAYVSPTQLNVLAPEGSAEASIGVQAVVNQQASNVVNTTKASFSPALFSFGQSGGHYVAAVAPDGNYVGPPNLIPGVVTSPVKAGSTVLLFGTGFGPTLTPTQIGQLPNVTALANPVTVRIGGFPALTQFAGIIGPGLYQFNVIVPDGLFYESPVVVEIGQSSSQSNVFLAIQK